jgi:uncharacterized delta-60 repeat protein
MKKFTFLIALTFLAMNIYSQDPGDLVTDFGNNGIIKEEWPDTSTIAFDILSLSDNNLVVPYNLSALADVICVAKLDESGEIMEFGNTTRGFQHDFSVFEMAQCAEEAPDGKILVAGTYGSFANYFPFVLRLLPNGELDGAFGEDGIYTDLEYDFRITCMAVYPQDDSYSILVAGMDIIEHMVLLMLDEDGNIDLSFGDLGKIDLGFGNGLIRDMVLVSENDDLYLCIDIETGGTRIMKLNLPDATPDEDFGTDGELIYTPTEGFSGTARSVVYKASNNTLALFGSYPHAAGDEDIFAYRVNAETGTGDASFGIGGWTTLRSAGTDDEINAAILQSDGKYYYGGVSDFNGTPDFLIGRLNDNGGPDVDFGINGLLLIDEPGEEEVYDITLCPNESKLYAIGIINGMEQSLMITAHFTDYEVLVSTAETDEPSLLVYPNPTSGMLQINTNSGGQHVACLTNITGARVIYNHFNTGNFTMDLSNLPSSVYFLSVTLPGGEVKCFKILKQD